MSNLPAIPKWLGILFIHFFEKLLKQHNRTNTQGPASNCSGVQNPFPSFKWVQQVNQLLPEKLQFHRASLSTIEMASQDEMCQTCSQENIEGQCLTQHVEDFAVGKSKTILIIRRHVLQGGMIVLPSKVDWLI